MMRTDTGHAVPAFLWAKGGHPFYETARRQVRRTRADHAYSMARGGMLREVHHVACKCMCVCMCMCAQFG